VALLHSHRQNVMKHGWRDACRIGIDQEEERVVRQNGQTRLHERIQAGLQLPHLTARPPSIGRRVHDDGVIAISAPLFTLDEFEYVIRNITDWPFTKTG